MAQAKQDQNKTVAYILIAIVVLAVLFLAWRMFFSDGGSSQAAIDRDLKDVPQKPADLAPVDDATKSAAPGTIDYK
jgi:hypothetical protein